MPNTIGVRELKNEASRVLRAVREQMAEYVITVRNVPVAVLRPLTEAEMEKLRQVETDDAMAEMKLLSQQIGAAWTSPRSGVELVEEQRR
jgi:prevent-host-death family protein